MIYQAEAAASHYKTMRVETSASSPSRQGFSSHLMVAVVPIPAHLDSSWAKIGNGFHRLIVAGCGMLSADNMHQ